MKQIKMNLVIHKYIYAYVSECKLFAGLFKKKVMVLVAMFLGIGTITGIAQSYNSPYNINLLYQGAAILQARIDANKDKVSDKVNDVFDTIDDVEITIGGFNEPQKKKLGNYILLCTISKIIKGHMIMYPFIIQSFFSFFFPFPSFLTLQERVFRKRGSRGSIFGL
ncbi:hypothetical protein PN613_18670 [Parabacteroides distasonis]|uniref:hypothetical protein n=1 Tax=Parabacteroides distasonis TaxID=823 RepID=UPI00189BCD3B|nr:hypothetical protein [Parabacteroides distasonis]MDB8998493.1 hypothetical protein [Parabacteroides distasonis]MDB9073246.1 hypothetical protein [Parabacteroides distasonis]